MADERPFESPGAGTTHASRRWRAMPRWARWSVRAPLFSEQIRLVVLVDVLEAYMGREGITQEEASRRFRVPRSRVSKLVNGRISKFTIDKLVNMAAHVGLVTRITFGREGRPQSDLRAARVDQP